MACGIDVLGGTVEQLLEGGHVGGHDRHQLVAGRNDVGAAAHRKCRLSGCVSGAERFVVRSDDVLIFFDHLLGSVLEADQLVKLLAVES